MSKKIKMKMAPDELKAFNEIWDVDIPMPIQPLEKLTVLIARELAIRFLKKNIGQDKAITISLLEYEAIALKVYVQWILLRVEKLPKIGAYEQIMITNQYLYLDQKTV